MITELFDLSNAHPSWHRCIREGLSKMDADYLRQLNESTQWLPGKDRIFNAFSQPANRVNYVLFGESPYPRHVSANGYAFWDENVSNLWSETGLSKQVNRATSLRNIIKMLLVADGALKADNTSQPAIAAIDKTRLAQSNDELFNNLIDEGFLLLNTSLVLQNQPPQKDARAWLPFVNTIIAFLLAERPHAHYILFGRIANTIEPLLPPSYGQKLICEHPYNISFITNNLVLDFFRSINPLISDKKQLHSG